MMSKSSTLLVEGSYLVSIIETVCTVYVMYKPMLHTLIHLLA
jgi:hypothetical protein